jgi:RHS repeat-associated protein
MKLHGIEVWVNNSRCLFSGLDSAANSWASATATDDYHEAFTYDANGNILTLHRNGLAAQALPMDTFTYRYTPGTNRLDHVKDVVNAANYNVDIDNQDTTNYRYDAIGNLTKDISEGIDTILWTLYGKVAAVSKADSNLLIRFAYNPMGQRVEKEVIRNADTTKTLYVHDASGNIMSVYTLRNGDSLKLNDVPIYGSSRLGVWNANKLLRIDSVLHDTEIQAQDPQDPATVDVSYHSAGEKQYELSNHLGNVLATVSDRKIPYYVSGALDHYQAEQLTGNDYYSFGMLMPDRSFSTGYRFGFNGQEKDEEFSGEGNHTTAMFWEYDTRLGRRWNQDPIIKSDQSGFVCFSNNPIVFIDPNGNTDYYNSRGKWIGTDGIDNGEKVMAISNSTAKTIKQATKASENIAMNPNVYKDMVRIPNQETIAEMKAQWKETEKKGMESVLVAGKNLSGYEDNLVKGGTEGKAPAGMAVEEFDQNCGNPEYTEHTHPLKQVAMSSGEIQISTPNPSYGDVLTAQEFEKDNSTFHNRFTQSMVIGPEYSQDNQSGAITYSTKITFFTGSNTTPVNPNQPLTVNSPMVPNAKMGFNQFTNAASKANEDQKKRTCD